MKISDQLKLKLKKTLVLTLAFAALALLINVVISFNQTKNNAQSFLVSNIKDIVRSAILNQNTANIDPEINKLYNLWKTTQSIETKIDVKLNHQTLSHVGTFDDTGLLSYLTTNSSTLPNGETLDVSVSLDLINQIAFAVFTLLILSVFLIGGYYLIKKNLFEIVQSITKPLEMRVAWLSQAAATLANHVPKLPHFQKSELQEVAALDQSLETFIEQIRSLEQTVASKNFDLGQIKMSERFAHGIKSKLAVLQLRIENVRNLNNDERTSLNQALNDISRASQNLLSSAGKKESKEESLDLTTIVEKCVKEQNELLASNPGYSLVLKPKNPNGHLFVKGNEASLSEAINNIIENAIESLCDGGEVVVELSHTDSTARIRISDNGIGIPDRILRKLTKERVTFGKQDGNGFGLYHTRQILEEVSGSLEINTKVGKGTEIIMSLPLIQTSPEEKEIIIPLYESGTLVIIDDDKLIHACVKMLLNSSAVSNLNIVDLYSVEEFEAWISKNEPNDFGNTVYWFDNDLKHDTKTGISLIETHALQFESYLISGMVSDEDVSKRVKAIGVKAIDKSDIPKIKFLTTANTDSQEMVSEILV